MYLIRVEMDKQLATVRRAIADCQQMHRLVTGLFGTDRQSSQILYRTNTVQGKLHIYLYSQIPALQSNMYEIQQRDISSWLDDMKADQTWGFDLVASPCKKVAVEGKKNSQRRILRDSFDRCSWLERKAEQSGFKILHVEEQEQIHISGRHTADKGGAMHHDGYRYKGILRITDADAFRRTMECGIGSGKAYGFGMMMVKPQ